MLPFLSDFYERGKEGKRVEKREKGGKRVEKREKGGRESKTGKEGKNRPKCQLFSHFFYLGGWRIFI